MLACGIA